MEELKLFSLWVLAVYAVLNMAVNSVCLVLLVRKTWKTDKPEPGPFDNMPLPKKKRKAEASPVGEPGPQKAWDKPWPPITCGQCNKTIWSDPTKTIINDPVVHFYFQCEHCGTPSMAEIRREDLAPAPQ